MSMLSGASAPQMVPDITRDSETYFLLTSLTSGQSAIITATARLHTLLITKKVPYVAVDIATDEKAKLLWKRRGNGKRLPVVVHDGEVLGNFEDMEQANEWGELNQTLGIAPPPRPPSLARSPSISSTISVSTTASKKVSVYLLPPSDPEPQAAIPTPVMQAAAQAAALAAQKRQSGILSSSASIKSVRGIASTVKQTASQVKEEETSQDEPASTVEETAPKVEEVAPIIEEVAPVVEEVVPVVEEVVPVVEEVVPVVEEVAPVVEEVAPIVEEAAPQVEEVTPKAEEPTPEVEEAPAPEVKELTKTRATGGFRNRAAVPIATRRNFAAPTARTITERAIKATGRASIDENKNSANRPGSRASTRPESRASDLRPQSRISVRPDSNAAKRTTMTGQEKKAPSITARSVKSVSSAATVKPTDKGGKAGKKQKSKIDKLKKEEVK